MVELVDIVQVVEQLVEQWVEVADIELGVVVVERRELLLVEVVVVVEVVV